MSKATLTDHQQALRMGEEARAAGLPRDPGKNPKFRERYFGVEHRVARGALRAYYAGWERGASKDDESSI